MKHTLVSYLVVIALGLTACAKSGNNHAGLDIRTRVYSPEGDAFLECSGQNGCPEELIKFMATRKPPTQAQLGETRRKWIYELEHPKAFHCDLPTIPWESWKIEEGGPTANLPGYMFTGDKPHFWSQTQKARRPQISDNDKPIGKVQQGNALWLVYRVLSTNELVTCEIWQGRDRDTGKDIADCDVKHRVPLELCTYSQTIIRGH